MDRHRFVVVGGGIAGMVTATRPGRRLGRRRRAHVVLVHHSPAHVWKPMLHTFASGTADYHNESISFIDQAARNGFQYVPGEFPGVDRARREVILGPIMLRDGRTELEGRTLPYDSLILAVGSRANDFGTAGVVEHCHFLNGNGLAQQHDERRRPAA